MLLKNNKSGAVLAFSIIISLALVIIATALFLTVNAAIKQATLGYDERQAYIYSKSGIEYAKSIAYSDLRDNGKIDNTTFYVSGNTPHSLSVSQHSNAGIYTIFSATEYSQADDEGNVTISYDFNVRSTAKYQASEPVTITYSGEINLEYHGINPTLPDDFNPDLIGSGKNAWYTIQSDGTAVLQKGDPISGTAAFNVICFVLDNSTDDGNLIADRTYFMKNPALTFKKNMRTTFTADFFAVFGDFRYEDERGNTDLILYPRNHSISGSTIAQLGAPPSLKYGIIYFAPNIKAFGTNLGGANGKYYFFPQGINLCDITPSNLNGLIPIDNINNYANLLEAMGQNLGFTFDESSISLGGSVS